MKCLSICFGYSSLFKIALGRTIWNIVDVIAIGLLISAFTDEKIKA
jgi:hypothetical protein